VNATRSELFSALIVVQAVHSVEEYVGRLWETFAPARFVVTQISLDPRIGFIIFNTAVVSFGAWCAILPVRRGWHSGTLFICIWIAIELVNGIAHPLLSIVSGGYTPGVATAPILLALSLMLLRRLR
jgi:hypothetical protein